MIPTVSVITPAYNAARFIGRAIDSVLAQTFTSLELIIIDDGSTDATPDIVRAYRDPRIVYLQQPNAGQGPARNRGIQACSGEYVTFLDADDFYLPTKVERQVQFLRAHPQFQVVYCRVLHYLEGRPEVVYRSREPGRSGNLLPQLMWMSYINPNAAMMTREVLERAGPFNETRYYPEEWEMWLKIALAGYKFGYIDEDLVVVEIREQSNTTMEIQPILKGNAVRMMEILLPATVEADGRRYPTAPAVRVLKGKQALAHLLVGERLAAARLIRQVVRPTWAGYAAGGFLGLLPPTLVRRLWRRRQVRRWDVLPWVHVDATRGRLLGR